MKVKSIIYVFFNVIATLIIFNPAQSTYSLSADWVAVPKSTFGNQFWDKNSVQKNPDGSIRVFSKFVPNNTTEITQDILYTMDINCSEKSFRDVALGEKEFNEYTNKNSDWQDPNGDILIIGTIDGVCANSN